MNSPPCGHLLLLTFAAYVEEKEESEAHRSPRCNRNLAFALVYIAQVYTADLAGIRPDGEQTTESWC